MGIKDFLSALKKEIFPKGITCNVCGRELSDGEREFSVCKACEEQFFEVDSVAATYDGLTVYSHFFYDAAARSYVLGYKDSDKPYLTYYMAKYIYNDFVALRLEADCVAYVPSSPSAIKRRGYDGMELVAEKFCEMSGLPINKNLFRVDGLDQTKVKPDERAKNVKNKFFSKGDFVGNVILLDDVVTSGATLRECADLIGHCGGRAICMTFSRAGKHAERT